MPEFDVERGTCACGAVSVLCVQNPPPQTLLYATSTSLPQSTYVRSTVKSRVFLASDRRYLFPSISGLRLKRGPGPLSGKKEKDTELNSRNIFPSPNRPPSPPLISDKWGFLLPQTGPHIFSTPTGQHAEEKGEKICLPRRIQDSGHESISCSIPPLPAHRNSPPPPCRPKPNSRRGRNVPFSCSEQGGTRESAPEEGISRG